MAAAFLFMKWEYMTIMFEATGWFLAGKLDGTFSTTVTLLAVYNSTRVAQRLKYYSSGTVGYFCAGPTNALAAPNTAATLLFETSSRAFSKPFRTSFML